MGINLSLIARRPRTTNYRAWSAGHKSDLRDNHGIFCWPGAFGDVLSCGMTNKAMQSVDENKHDDENFAQQ